jgi:hypothetical protein
MSPDEVMSLLHQDGSSLPPVCPCNRANACDTKTLWSAEELHRIMGCRKFCNYKNLLQVCCYGEWVDGGEFPPLLGLLATIPKSKLGLPLDQTAYKYMFGDCLLVRGF